MANNFKISNAAANAAADAVAALCNSGKLRIYSGSQPTDANTALGAQTLLAELTFGSTAFGASSAGVATANAITPATAGATGTAGFFRVVKSDGSTVVYDGSVGLSSTDLVLGTTSIVSGATVSVSSLTYTQPES